MTVISIQPWLFFDNFPHVTYSPFVPADDRAALPVGDAGWARGARLPGPGAPGRGLGPAAPPHAVDQPGRPTHFHLPGPSTDK